MKKLITNAQKSPYYSMKTITIKNFQIDSVFKVLSYPMNFQKGRVKNRFLEILREKHKAVNDSRIEMLNDFAEKDPEKKTPIIENGAYKLSPENQQKFNEEYAKLMNEDCVIDVLPSLEKDIPMIKQLFNDSTVELNDQQIAECDLVLEAISNYNKPVVVKKPEPAEPVVAEEEQTEE